MLLHIDLTPLHVELTFLHVDLTLLYIDLTREVFDVLHIVCRCLGNCTYILYDTCKVQCTHNYITRIRNHTYAIEHLFNLLHITPSIFDTF